MPLIEIEERLLEEINVKKNKLIVYTSQFELTDERVVHCSQELDKLLNQYQEYLLDSTFQKITFQKMNTWSGERD